MFDIIEAHQEERGDDCFVEFENLEAKPLLRSEHENTAEKDHGGKSQREAYDG